MSRFIRRPREVYYIASNNQTAVRVSHFSLLGFESHLGLRFFLCPLMVDSLHLPLFPLLY